MPDGDLVRISVKPYADIVRGRERERSPWRVGWGTERKEGATITCIRNTAAVEFNRQNQNKFYSPPTCGAGAPGPARWHRREDRRSLSPSRPDTRNPRPKADTGARRPEGRTTPGSSLARGEPGPLPCLAQSAARAWLERG
eukprot:scaffold6231_cov59-Phaeocystis_antarctica.AAC.3